MSSSSTGSAGAAGSTGSNASSASSVSSVSSGANQAPLERVLNLRSVVLFGLAYMTPLIGLGIFGVIATKSQGAAAGAYLLALVAMLFTAASYGRLASRFAIGGSAYTYVGKSIGPKAGFLVGWTVLLDYMFLPMVIWLIGAAYVGSIFPGVPHAVSVLTYIVITTIINIIGLKVADKVNFVLMVFQFAVIAAFVVLSIVYLTGNADQSRSLSEPFIGHGGFPGITAGAAVAAYAYLGFDAVTTLTDETKEPEKTMPRAIMLVALIGGAVFVILSYSAQLVHPGMHFGNEDAAATDMALTVGGTFFQSFIVAALVVAQFTSGIAAQTSASRLLYTMGRDGALPRAWLSKMSKRFSTPWAAVLTVSVVGLLALFLDVNTSTSFVNFGAFFAFTLVNVSVVVLGVATKRSGGSWNVFTDAILPVLGAVIVFTLLTQLDSAALTIGGIWLVIGIAVLGYLTKGFRHDPPHVADDAFD